jgi:methylated-DNA-[protein]-cysteine S-methyltransferase
VVDVRKGEVFYDAEGWGVGELWFEDDILVWHELPRPCAPPSSPPLGGREVPRVSVPRKESPDCDDFVPELVARLQAYFAGERVELGDVALDLEWCTPFQRAVADALRDVPYGELVTYGELAALAGHPNAQRAAGTFCARNRLPIFLPCHRVVAADGLGQYGSLGTGYKRRLLELEDAVL